MIGNSVDRGELNKHVDVPKQYLEQLYCWWMNIENDCYESSELFLLMINEIYTLSYHLSESVFVDRFNRAPVKLLGLIGCECMYCTK